MKSGDALKELRKAIIPLEGVHCASCVLRLETGLSSLPGLRRVSVNLPSRTAFVTYDPAAARPETIAAKIGELGYKALTITDSAAGAGNIAASGLEAERDRMFRRFGGAAALTALLSLDMIVRLPPALLAAAAAAAWGWSGAHFHTGALRALRARTADMNTLVSLSTSVIFFYGLLVTLVPDFAPHQPAQWHELGMLVAFINLGRWLEGRTRSRAAEAISGLIRLAPKSATVLRGGREAEVPAGEIIPGDTVLLRPGAQVPVDGTVVAGFSSVDESLLTGEPVPREKGPGARVFAGTVNKEGSLRFSATGVGEDMTLAKIVRAVSESQAGKNSAQRLADRISARFVPAVLLIAAVSAAVWYYFEGLPAAVSVFAAVLAVACPCAMGLAVPMAVSAGFGRAAGLGALINNAETLERVPKIDTIVLDKTGTLTEGRLRVTGLFPRGGGEEEFLRLLLTAELNSEHPFAAAVRAFAAERKVTAPAPDSAEAVPGKGVRAVAGGTELLAGSPGWFAGAGIPLPPEAAARLGSSAGSMLLLAADGEYRGMAELSDSLRPEARAVVDELRGMGITPVIASGDRRGAVEAAAAALDIKEFHAEVLPEDKSRIIARLKAEGHRTAFVGDGFNDAAALSEADIGIALHSGADIAVKASDITLMSGGLAGVARAIRLARAIKLNMAQNLFWAFAYNIALIPLAAGVLYPFTGFTIPPHFAGAAMALSSVSVVLNSLRLRSVKV